MCATLHVLWSLVYIGCGAIQLVVGIFFLVMKNLPFFRLGSNVFAGGWNVVVGVSGAMVACVGPLSSPGRHEALLYLAVSVLAVNAINLAVLEVAEWRLMPTEEALEKQEDNVKQLIEYARIGTSAACVLAMAVAFFDSQLTFCSLQHALRRRLQRRRSSKTSHSHHSHHHDHTADSEYIILPRVRPSTKNGYEQYTRSWVFDVDGGSTRYQQLDSNSSHSHADKCRDAAAAAVAAAEGRSASSRSSTQRGDTYTVADTKALRAAIANGGPCPGSSSPAGSGPGSSKQYSRQLKHKELMREREHQKQLREQQQYVQRQQRQRPTSTGSAASSAASSAGPGPPHHQPPAIEESPPSGTSPDSPAVDSQESRSPDSGEHVDPADDQEGVGYHSLMSELTQVIRKKPSPSTGPGGHREQRDRDARDDTSSADFNRELEAALQDIHDLDSSTGGTLVNASSAASSSAPPPPAPDWGDSDEESTASSRTVSGKRRSHPRLGRAFAIPVPPPVPPPQAGEVLWGTLRSTSSTLRRHSSQAQQRTPSPEPSSPPPSPPGTGQVRCRQSPVRSKTVVTICDGDMVVREMNNNEIVLVPLVLPTDPGEFPPAPSLEEAPKVEDILSNHVEDGDKDHSSPNRLQPPSPIPTSPESGPEGQGCSMGSVGRLGGLSLLRKGRRRASSGCTVRLSQELQGAVLQSESLVFLSDSELVARHERNRRVQREIEQRVQQQISGHSTTDSLC